MPTLQSGGGALTSDTLAILTALQSQPPCNFRNLIDGGDFTVNPWQRGTSFTGIANTLTYTADRWFAVGASTSSVSVSQQAVTAIPGFAKVLQFGRAAANTDVNPITLGQVFETPDCYRLQGQTVTFSFWAAAGANFSGANIDVKVAYGSGNNQSAATFVAGTWTTQANAVNALQNLTTGFVRYQFTAVIPIAATQVGVSISYTPNGTAGAADYIQLMGLQFEVGAQASNFEFRDVAVELEICQRYCYVAGGVTGAIGSGAATSTTAAGFYVPFPVTMRTAPTAISTATIADLSVYTYANASVGALSAAAFGSASVNGIHVTTTSSGMTAGTPYVLYVATALAGNVTISADL